MADITDVSADILQETSILATSKQTESEDESITFFGDWAKSISQFSADDTKGLNLIRTQAAGVLSSLSSIYANTGQTFGTVVAWRDSVLGVLEALQGLLESLLALDRMLMYQMYRAQSFRFNDTLGALNNGCGILYNHIEAYQTLFDLTPSELFDFSWFTDDWKVRTETAEDLLNEALHDGSDSDIVTTEWKLAEQEIYKISVGEGDGARQELFRNYINTRNATNAALNEFKANEEKLRQQLQDNLDLIENLKKTARLNALVRKSVTKARDLMAQARLELRGAETQCEFDPKDVLAALSKALSKSDAAYLILSNMEHNSLKEYLDLDDLGTEDPCLKYALKAYLSDAEQLKNSFPDTSLLYGAARNYLGILDNAAVTGIPPNAGDLEAAKKDFQNEMDFCCEFIESAEVLHDQFVNGPLSTVLAGPIEALSRLSEAGTGISGAMDIILNARILTITDYRVFMSSFPAGRLLLIIMECLGLSDKLPEGVMIDIATSRSLSDLRQKLEALTGKVEELTREWSEKIDAVFRYFNAIDSEIAAFISALISLLFYCDRGQMFALRDSDVFTLAGSREDFLTQGISESTYNSAAGNTGSLLDAPVDPALPGNLGGTRDDECRC